MILSSRLRAFVFLASLSFLWGCGYIGEPLPPLLNIPGRGENVTAVQRGANIIVHVTLPTLTTEGVVLKQAIRLDLRIGPKPAGQLNLWSWAGGARAITGETTANGIAEYHIPAAEWVGKEVLLTVRVIGANGRDVGWATPADITVVPPLEQPHDLAAIAVPQGVGLTWHGAGNLFSILRRGPDEPDYKPVGRSATAESIDATAEFGKPYHYLVQAISKAGDGEAQSELSNEVTITPQDTFPPSAPVGLVGVPSTASIELVWERNPEPNVVEYRVYRALGNGALERIAEGVSLPAYSDRKVESGKTYRYAVTALKANKVESKQSTPVEVTSP